MADFDLSVTICSWNTADDLCRCLQALEVERNSCSFEVIVVDNNSEDGSPDRVEQDFPWVRLLRQSRNLGFTGGHNLALEARRGRHAFLLNSDAFVHPGCLRTLLDHAASHPELGILGPKLLNEDGSLQFSCRRFPNPLAALFRSTPLGKLFPNNPFTRDYLMLDFDHSRATEVDWVSGAAMFATEAFLERVGFLDPNYFMYCEDTDWCFQAWQAGFRVGYVPDAVVTHAIGRSTDKAPNRMVIRFHRSMFYFYRKNMVSRMPPVARPFALAYAGLGLTARAGLFIAKNLVDRTRRRFLR